ncbi:MAG: DUF4859 domain-containing protein [Prevotella sp.]|nr:DUF4859 domain-containing protein [Prevotella sp.]
MMMTTTHLRNLLLAVMCLFTGMAAQAQFTGTIELPVSAKNFTTNAISFKLSEVAATVETDAATLAAALDAWEAGTNDMFFLVNPQDNSLQNNYTQGGKGGFWVTAEGIAEPWGTEGLTWFNTIGWDVEADEFVITMGQYPDVSKEGDQYPAQFVLQYGEKQATFNVTLSMTATEDIDAPEPATVIEKDLNIVGEASVDVTRMTTQGYEATAVKMELPGIAEKFGITMNMLGKVLDDILYTPHIDAYGGKLDSLTNESTAGAPGWWYSRQSEDETGNIPNEVVADGYGASSLYFTEGFKIEDDSLAFNLGQYPGHISGNETLYNNVYIMYGDKAYRIRVNVTFEKPEWKGLDEMTKVGEKQFEISQAINTGYNTTTIYLPVEEIETGLGCALSEASFMAIDNNGDLSGNMTAESRGYWLDAGGQICSWGSTAAMYVLPVEDTDVSSLNVAQMPNGALKIGDVCNANLYLVNSNNGTYYQIGIQLTVTDKQAIEDLYTIVATRTALVQTLVTSNYSVSNTYTLPTEQIEELLGIRNPKLYAADSTFATTGSKYSDAYSCDPKPGFWLSKDGYASVWSSESPVGISMLQSGGEATGVFQLFQYPGANNVGDVFKASLFMANDETKKMIQINFTVQFVADLIDYETVGEESILLPVDMADMVIDIDLQKAATALETTVDNLMDGYKLKGMAETSLYGEGFNPVENGLSFNIANGAYDELGQIHLLFVQEGDGYVIDIISDEEVEDGYRTEGDMCFEIDTKRYVYHLTFVDPETYTGISNVVEKNGKDGKTYDLSGRMVNNPAKGIYIQNGKKYVVK